MTRTEFLLIFAACLVWAFHYVVAKLAVGVAPPLFYAAMRMSLLAIVLAPLLRWHSGRMKEIFLAGALLGGLNFGLFFSGMTLASASSAAIATQMGAPVVTLLSVAFLGERVGWRRGLGIAIAFIGVTLIAFKPNETALSLGVVLVIASVVVEAFGAIIVKRLAGIPPLALQAWFGLVGASVLIVATLTLETGRAAALAEGGWRRGLAVSYSALGASLFSFSIYYWLLQRHDVSKVAPVTLLMPLMAVGFGVILLGDQITPLMAIGAVMTLSGVGVVLLRSGARMRAAGELTTESAALSRDENGGAP